MPLHTRLLVSLSYPVATTWPRTWSRWYSRLSFVTCSWNASPHSRPCHAALSWSAPLRGKVNLSAGKFLFSFTYTHWLHFNVRRPLRRVAFSLAILVFHFLTLHGQSCVMTLLQLMVKGNFLLFRSGGMFLLTARRRWTDLPATATYNSSLLHEIPSFHWLVAIRLLFGVSCLLIYPVTFTHLTFPPTIHTFWK